ncbi:MAG: hypothetical protein KF703_09320, partial [Actinobacteria bacterium]|nr:hypothetical protein [Actinomycetota bacterium]
DEVHLDLGEAADHALLDRLLALDPVLSAVPVARGAQVRVADREAVPAVVAACVAHGAAVYGVDARTPTLEDVYFEIEARSDAAHLAAAS